MKKSLFAIAMIACTCMTANAEHTIYVSTTGNDAVADGSAAKPYYSLQQAINKAVAVSGTDTVTVDVQPGIYTVQQTISVTQSPKTPLLVRCSAATSAPTRRRTAKMTLSHLVNSIV